MTDIVVEDLKHPTQLGISNNDWNCTRLGVIVDDLNSQSGILFVKPYDQLTYDLNVYGIVCRNESENSVWKKTQQIFAILKMLVPRILRTLFS